MAQQSISDLYRCDNCDYHGLSRVTGASAFMAMIGLLILSAWFLPLIIVALGFMVWMISKPAKRYCPKCKSSQLTQITAEDLEDWKKKKQSDSAAQSEVKTS